MPDNEITLFYIPQSRARGTRFLLEELGLPYRLHVLNMKSGENREADYLAVNPLGKVPAILDRGHLITEQAAVCLHLADLAADKGLTPLPGDPDRGPYLRFAVFYNACFEPALIDKALGRGAPPRDQSAYGTYDEVIGILRDQLSKGPYMLGERMTAIDFLWGTAFNWTLMFGIVPQDKVFVDYAARMTDRPSYRMITEDDARMAEEHARIAARLKSA